MSSIGVSKRVARFLGTSIREQITGMLFCMPWILGLLIFTAYPVVRSFWWSFTDYRIMNVPTWIGLDNYAALLEDPTIILSMKNTIQYAAIYLPSLVIFSITLAMLLNTEIIAMSFYRSLYYMPVLVPAVASAIVWRQVLDPQWGVMNNLLRSLRLPTIGWIGSPTWSKPSLALIGLWGMGNTVVIYLAALQDVPPSLYDAAKVDGANLLQKTLNITLPMITPVILFNLIMGLIGTFQTFSIPFIMTDGHGAPAQSLLFYSMVLYRRAFLYLQMGPGSAMAWMMLLFILFMTLIVLRTSGRWVYYAGK